MCLQQSLYDPHAASPNVDGGKGHISRKFNILQSGYHPKFPVCSVYQLRHPLQDPFGISSSFLTENPAHGMQTGVRGGATPEGRSVRKPLWSREDLC